MESTNTAISFDELKLSKPLPKDLIRPKPVWEVLEDIHQVLTENNIVFEQDVIHIDKLESFHSDKKKDSHNLPFDHDNPESFGSWTFKDLLTKIVITDALNEFEGAMAIAYNSYGLQIAFGLTYQERSHFAYFGEDDAIMSTAACGEIKVVPYFVMMHRVRQWFPFNNINTINLLEKTKTLIGKTMDHKFILQFIEQFNQYSRKYNDCLEQKKLIDTETFDYFVNMLRYYAREHLSKRKKLTAWDLVTIGNKILQPGSELHLRSIIPLGYIWGGHVFSRLA